jgi:hypothetical protein
VALYLSFARSTRTSTWLTRVNTQVQRKLNGSASNYYRLPFAPKKAIRQYTIVIAANHCHPPGI